MPGNLRVRWRRLSGVLGGVALGLAAAFCVADEPASARSLHVLVLKSGALVDGEIHESAGGYLVELPTGEMLVPYDTVEVAAPDRHDAYRRLRERLPSRTPAMHAGLARWCLSHAMYDEARTELRDSLSLDPNDREARSMLRRLDELLHPETPPAAETDSPRVADNGSAPPAAEVRSLAGLPRDVARDFVARVQPLLMNKCGNAACHGTAGRTDFHIAPVRRGSGSSRLLTERNLAAVLRRIDMAHPAQSQLLAACQGEHGHTGRPIFEGPGAKEQHETLRQWIDAVARDQMQGETRPQQPWALDRHIEDEKSAAMTLIRGREEPAAPQPPEDILDRVLREERKDAFDPDEFNRRVHGTQR